MTTEDQRIQLVNFSQEEWHDIFAKLTYNQLQDMRAAITVRMKEMRDTGITQLRAMLAEQAQLLGVDLKDLIPKSRRKYKRRQKADDNDSIEHPQEN